MNPRLGETTSALLVIDIQEKFTSVIRNWPGMLAASERMIRFYCLLGAPILVTEQYPKGLGATAPEIKAALDGAGAPVLGDSAAGVHASVGAKGGIAFRISGPNDVTGVIATPGRLEKTVFSAAGSDPLREAVRKTGKKQWVLVGIETHVCVSQTALDLLDMGLEVFIPADAVSSRRDGDRAAALERLARAGAVVSTTESLMFEAIRDAKHPLFRQVSALVK
ncbi:MAG: isochorismatase family protein [Planctomycetota bacterium]